MTALEPIKIGRKQHFHFFNINLDSTIEGGEDTPTDNIGKYRNGMETQRTSKITA